MRAVCPRRPYAFEKHRHWIEPTRSAATPVVAEAEAPVLQRLDAMENWFSVPQWLPASVAPNRATPETGHGWSSPTRRA